MRKPERGAALLFLFFLCVSLPLPGSALDSAPTRYDGTGLHGIALSGDFSCQFGNPAALVFDDGGLYASVSFADTGWNEEPMNSFIIAFSGHNLGLAIEQSTDFTNGVDNGDSTDYKAVKTTEIEFNWAYLFWQHLAVGASIDLHTGMRRNPSTISDDFPFFDLVVETLFQHYETQANETEIQAALGMQLVYSWWAFGVLWDDMAGATNEGDLEFYGGDFADNLDFGLTLSTPRYDRDSQLLLLRLLVSAEAIHPFDQDASEFRGGADLRFQFLPDVQLDLLAGYRGKIDFAKIADFNDDDWSDTKVTCGIGFVWDTWSVNLSAEADRGILEGASDWDGSWKIVLTYNK